MTPLSVTKWFVTARIVLNYFVCNFLIIVSIMIPKKTKDMIICMMTMSRTNVLLGMISPKLTVVDKVRLK